MAYSINVKGIAFDLDGTLVDSAPGLAEAISLAMKELNLPKPGLERVVTWIGNGAEIMMTRALHWALDARPDPEIVTRARKCFDYHYLQTADTGSKLFPGVKQTLIRLQQRGIPMAIITNKPSHFVQPLLNVLGISDFFSLVIGGDDVPVKKPHPAAIFMVLGQFGLLPKELLLVGDSKNDIQAAKAAGVTSVGLTYGYNYGEPIAGSHPGHIIDTLEQLLPPTGN